MNITSVAVRPAVQQAIAHAIIAAERREEIAFAHTLVPAFDKLDIAHGSASILVLDLHGHTPWAVLQVVREWLEAHPFTKVVVVPVPLAGLDDQRVLFDLGRAMVAFLPTVQQAQSPEWWLDVFADGTQYDCVVRSHRDLRRQLPTGNVQDFLLRVAEHSNASSVKELAARMYPTSRATLASKRRKLWEECKAAGVHSPENALTGVRLLMIKSLLDQNVWSLLRIARHFGFASARHLARSCKTRYERTLTQIRQASTQEIYEQVRYGLWAVALLLTTPWSLLQRLMQS